MKKILVLCAVVLLTGAVLIWRAVAAPSRFGKFTGAPRADVVALIETPKAYVGKTVLIEGTVTEQCQAMGCYFSFHSGQKSLKVDLQDVAMTAPMREGRPARVEGQILPRPDGYQFFASAVEFR